MGRFQKQIKKYERHLLLGLVILLLVSFSVTGAIECAGGGEAKDWGGEFNVSPSTRDTLDNDSFVSLWRTRVPAFRASVGSMSLRFPPHMYQLREPDGWPGAWTHALPVAAAQHAGYRCGEEYQLPAAIRSAVRGRLGIEFNDASYDMFLRDYYRAGATAFQNTVREVVIKDAFLRPLIETPRYSIPYDEAYEVWKKLLQRVDLDYVVLRGEDFGLAARQQETTRTRISRQVDLLQAVSNTARTLDGTRARLDTWRRNALGGEIARLRGEGQSEEEAKAAAEASVPWPENLDVLGGMAPKDAWDVPIRLTVDGQAFALSSAGPDGTFDSSDDVTLEILAQIQTRVALRDVGNALQRWHEATKAWPETLDAMREAPKEGALAPLKGPADDAWKQTLVLETGAEGAAPRLFSKGPDGQAGTADDVAALVSTEAVIVPPGIAFIPFLTDEDKDAWDRPMRVDFTAPISWGWRVTSAGANGTFGNADDLNDGNRGEVDRFFMQPEIQREFQEPARREFEAVYAHLPLVPDEALKVLWEKYPKHHPDQMLSFDHWRQMGGMIYKAETPADAETGHGVEEIRLIYPDATLTIVPDASIFGDIPEEFDLAIDANKNDPNKVEYVESGWRAIVLRERFFESLLNDLLTRARDSHRAELKWTEARAALDAWTGKKAAFDAGEGEDPGASPEDPGEKPETITFESLLQSELAAVLPAEGETPWIGFYRTEKPLERSEWESLTDFGGIDFSEGLRRLKEDGQYAAIPSVLRESHTRAILRNLVDHPMRQKELDEVYDEVFERYLEGKQLDVAEAKLRDLRDRVQKASITTTPEPGGEEGDGTPEREAKDPWETVLAAWSKELGAGFVRARTGWFVGARPPEARDPGDDVADDEKASLAQRDFVRVTGYDTIRQATSKGEELTPGTLGREVLRDDMAEGTDAVYLVRLADFRYPPPEAFSPRAYADYLTAEIIGRGLPKGGLGMGAAAGGERVDIGVISRGVQDYLCDFDFLRRKYGLVPSTTPEAQPER